MHVQWRLQSFWGWLYQWFFGMDSNADSSNVSEGQTLVQQLVEAHASELMDLYLVVVAARLQRYTCEHLYYLGNILGIAPQRSKGQTRWPQISWFDGVACWKVVYSFAVVLYPFHGKVFNAEDDHDIL